LNNLIKFLLILLLVNLTAAKLHAIPNIYLDAAGALTDTGEDTMKFGGVGSIGVEILENTNALFRFSLLKKEEKNGATYDQKILAVGAEYVYPFFRFGWKNSIWGGLSMLGIDVSGFPGISDSGVYLALHTGVEYDLTQHIAPFVEIGYGFSYYTGDLDGSNSHSFNFLFGIRVTIGGNKSISKEY